MYILDIIDKVCPIKSDIKDAIETKFKYIHMFITIIFKNGFIIYFIHNSFNFKL